MIEHTCIPVMEDTKRFLGNKGVSFWYYLGRLLVALLKLSGLLPLVHFRGDLNSSLYDALALSSPFLMLSLLPIATTLYHVLYPGRCMFHVPLYCYFLGSSDSGRRIRLGYGSECWVLQISKSGLGTHSRRIWNLKAVFFSNLPYAFFQKIKK